MLLKSFLEETVKFESKKVAKISKPHGNKMYLCYMTEKRAVSRT